MALSWKDILLGSSKGGDRGEYVTAPGYGVMDREQMNRRPMARPTSLPQGKKEKVPSYDSDALTVRGDWRSKKKKAPPPQRPMGPQEQVDFIKRNMSPQQPLPEHIKLPELSMPSQEDQEKAAAALTGDLPGVGGMLALHGLGSVPGTGKLSAGQLQQAFNQHAAEKTAIANNLSKNTFLPARLQLERLKLQNELNKARLSAKSGGLTGSNLVNLLKANLASEDKGLDRAARKENLGARLGSAQKRLTQRLATHRDIENKKLALKQREVRLKAAYNAGLLDRDQAKLEWQKIVDQGKQLDREADNNRADLQQDIQQEQFGKELDFKKEKFGKEFGLKEDKFGQEKDILGLRGEELKAKIDANRAREKKINHEIANRDLSDSQKEELKTERDYLAHQRNILEQQTKSAQDLEESKELENLKQAGREDLARLQASLKKETDKIAKQDDTAIKTATRENIKRVTKEFHDRSGQVASSDTVGKANVDYMKIAYPAISTLSTSDRAALFTGWDTLANPQEGDDPKALATIFKQKLKSLVEKSKDARWAGKREEIRKVQGYLKNVFSQLRQLAADSDRMSNQDAARFTGLLQDITSSDSAHIGHTRSRLVRATGGIRGLYDDYKNIGSSFPALSGSGAINAQKNIVVNHMDYYLKQNRELFSIPEAQKLYMSDGEMLKYMRNSRDLGRKWKEIKRGGVTSAELDAFMALPAAKEMFRRP